MGPFKQSSSIIFLLILFLLAGDASGYERILRVSDNNVITFDQMIAELKGIDVIFIGELHTTEKHHKAQHEIIKALHKSGVSMTVGLEMLTVKSMGELDRWINGKLEQKAMQTIFENSWKYPWSLYKDIFLLAKNSSIPMAGLNIERETAQKVGQYGVSSLTAKEMETLPPDISCEVDGTSYMDFLRIALLSHGQEERKFVYFCETQMLWDKTMAWNIMDILKKKYGNTVIVLAGVGHSWKRGIPLQLRKNSEFISRVILPEIPGSLDQKTIKPENADYLLLD